jgi:quinol-cytochrome oxidoreductase complex cytochrome b subunit
VNRLVKVLVFLVLFAAFVALLFTIVFPWVDRTLITDPTLEALRAPRVLLA